MPINNTQELSITQLLLSLRNGWKRITVFTLACALLGFVGGFFLAGRQPPRDSYAINIGYSSSVDSTLSYQAQLSSLEASWEMFQRFYTPTVRKILETDTDIRQKELVDLFVIYSGFYQNNFIPVQYYYNEYFPEKLKDIDSAVQSIEMENVTLAQNIAAAAYYQETLSSMQAFPAQLDGAVTNVNTMLFEISQLPTYRNDLSTNQKKLELYRLLSRDDLQKHNDAYQELLNQAANNLDALIMQTTNTVQHYAGLDGWTVMSGYDADKSKLGEYSVIILPAATNDSRTSRWVAITLIGFIMGLIIGSFLALVNGTNAKKSNRGNT